MSPRVLLVMDPDVAGRLLGDDGLARLAAIADVHPRVLRDLTGPAAADALATAEVLLTHWGCPVLDAGVLDRAPLLRAVVHAAGSVKGLVTDACWDRGLRVSSAAWANAVPVAEYALAAILLAGKGVLAARERYRAERYRAERAGPVDWHAACATAGNYRRRVGVVGASLVGRRVLELLRPHDLEVAVHDPFLSAGQARLLGVSVAGLDELCATADVLSLHAPELPETRRLLDRRRLALMRDGATVVNTARGSLIDGAAFTAELVSGRLNAVLDVTDPEPLPADSPLYELPNVLLTPHVAGSMGNEMGRLFDAALTELGRYAAGLEFAHPVLRSRLSRTA